MAEAYPLEADVAFQDLHSSLAEERPQGQLTQLLDSDKPAVTNKEKKRQLAAQLEGRQSAFSDDLLVGSLHLLRVDDRGHDVVSYVNEDFEFEYWDNRHWPKHRRHLKKQLAAMPENRTAQGEYQYLGIDYRPYEQPADAKKPVKPSLEARRRRRRGHAASLDEEEYAYTPYTVYHPGRKPDHPFEDLQYLDDEWDGVQWRSITKGLADFNLYQQPLDG